MAVFCDAPYSCDSYGWRVLTVSSDAPFKTLLDRSCVVPFFAEFSNKHAPHATWGRRSRI